MIMVYNTVLSLTAQGLVHNRSRELRGVVENSRIYLWLQLQADGRLEGDPCAFYAVVWGNERRWKSLEGY